MKFDLLDLFQHYDLFFTITGDKMEAIVLYIYATLFIFLTTFLIVRAIFYNGFKFKGKGKVMKAAFAIISYFVTDFAYKFLEKFTAPLAWFYKYWWIIFVGTLALGIIYGTSVIVIEERKERENNKNNQDLTT